MPTTRRRRRRELCEADGLTQDAYQYFALGPMFGGEDYERATTEAERMATWKRLRRPILERYLERIREEGPKSAGRRPREFWRELEDQGHERRVIGTDSYWPCWGSDGPGPPKKERVYNLIENDWMFLDRLHLLEPWEVAAGDPDEGKGIF